MIGGRPEFSRSVPRGSLLLIDAVLQKIVCAALVSSVMESNAQLGRFLYESNRDCHIKWSIFAAERWPVGGGLNAVLLYLIRI